MVFFFDGKTAMVKIEEHEGQPGRDRSHLRSFYGSQISLPKINIEDLFTFDARKRGS